MPLVKIFGLKFGDEINSISWEIASASYQLMNNLSISFVQSGINTNVFTGNYTASLGWNIFNFQTPVIWNGDDILIETCFDNSNFTNTNDWFYSVTPFQSCEFEFYGCTLGECINFDNFICLHKNVRGGRFKAVNRDSNFKC